jgi:hypothetical protein
VRRAGISAAGAVGAVALAAAGAVWLVAFRDTAEPVGVDDAVTSFREDTTEEPRASPVRAGVYVYATQGYERTDALTGVTHRYPRRSTITVAAATCGVTLTWRVLEGRSTRWTYCATDEGWELSSQEERHTFFGRTETTTYACEATPILPRQPVEGASWAVSECAAGDTTETGVMRVVGLPRLRVGDERVATVHVRKLTELSGSSRGTSRHDLWFDGRTALPVRLALVSRTASESPIGDVRYDEDVTLTLLSLEPRR